MYRKVIPEHSERLKQSSQNELKIKFKVKQVSLGARSLPFVVTQWPPRGLYQSLPITVVRCDRPLATVRHDDTRQLPCYASVASLRCLQPHQTRDLPHIPAPAHHSQLVDSLLELIINHHWCCYMLDNASSEKLAKTKQRILFFRVYRVCYG